MEEQPAEVNKEENEVKQEENVEQPNPEVKEVSNQEEVQVDKKEDVQPEPVKEEAPQQEIKEEVPQPEPVKEEEIKTDKKEDVQPEPIKEEEIKTDKEEKPPQQEVKEETLNMEFKEIVQPEEIQQEVKEDKKEEINVQPEIKLEPAPDQIFEKPKEEILPNVSDKIQQTQQASPEPPKSLITILNETEIERTEKIIICPKCGTIPLIDVELKDEGRVHLKCVDEKCKFEETKSIEEFMFFNFQLDKKDLYRCPVHPKSSGSMFCVQCSKWLCDQCVLTHQKENEAHQTLNFDSYETRNIDLVCKTHNKPYSFFCSECNKHFCKECDTSSHLSHKKLFDIDNISALIELNTEGIMSSISRAQNYLDIDCQNFVSNCIQNLSIIIGNIKLSYQKFKMKNQYIIDLMRIIVKNYRESTPNKYLLNNLLMLNQMKNKNYIDKNKDLISNDLINYFDKEFVFEYDSHYLDTINNMIYAQKSREKWSPDLLFFRENLATNSLCLFIPGSYCIFNTNDENAYLAYTNKDNPKNLEIKDLNFGSTFQIPNAHEDRIYCCKHYYDKKEKRDLIITSSKDKNIKIWDVSNHFKNILSIKTGYEKSFLFSSAILFNEKSDIFVVGVELNDVIKIWDSRGKLKKTLGDSKMGILSVEVYYVEKKTYILVGTTGVYAYDSSNGKLFNKYIGEDDKAFCKCFKLGHLNKSLKLITGDNTGNINIFDFSKGLLLMKISDGSKCEINSLCIWSTQYIFAGYKNNTINLLSLQNGQLIKTFNDHTGNDQEEGGIGGIEKYYHSYYGNCFVSQGGDGNIKLYTISMETENLCSIY